MPHVAKEQLAVSCRGRMLWDVRISVNVVTIIHAVW